MSDVDPSKKLLADASSLVDLKAEVFRKYQEAKFNKIHGRKTSEPRPSSSSNKIWSRANVGLQQRQNRDLQDRALTVDNENKVQEVLTKKAALYDQLKQGKGPSDRFLVQFRTNDSDSDEDLNDPHDYEANNEEEEWVEYTDSLGRTRTCMKKDLKSLKRQDQDLQKDMGPASTSHSDQPDLMSEDMRREMLREKWEKEEEENLKKRNLHYNDVLFDEARTHGEKKL